MPSTPSPAQRQLLEKVFTTALGRGFSPIRAETYGVWILCFARYCKAHDVDPPSAAQVPNFMDYLANRPDLTASEREHALDAVLVALTEVPHAFASGAPPDRTLPAHGAASPSGYDPNTETTPGGRALTHLLMETDVRLYDAVRLSISDIDRENGVLHVRSGPESRRVPLTDSLRSDLGAAARQALARGSTHLFPDAYRKYVRSSGDAGEGKEAPGAEAERSQTAGGRSLDAAAGEASREFHASTSSADSESAGSRSGIFPGG